VALGAGTHDVGRGPAVDVAIEDPSLSARHVVVDVSATGATIADAGSRNGTAIDGQRLPDGATRPVSGRDHIEIGRSLVVLRPARSSGDATATARGGVVEFNRPPRMARPYDPPRIEVPAPPSKPTAPRLPLAASLAPLVLGVAMFFLLNSAAMLLFSALSPVMAVSTFMTDRRGGRKKYISDLAAFEERIGSLAGELEALRAVELDALRADSPDPAELSARAERHLNELWERRRADADFLSLRLGIADQPTQFEVALGRGGEEDQRKRAEAIVAGSATLVAAPLVASLPEAIGLGLTGATRHVDALGRWLVLQAAVLHSPRDVLIAAALSSGREQAWGSLRWLPHCNSPTSPIDHEHVAVGEAQANALLRAVATVAEQRRVDDRDRYSGRSRRRAFIVLVVDEDVAPPRALIEELLTDGDAPDIALVWLGRDRRDLPGGCGVTVELAGDRAAMTVAWPASGRVVADATPDGIDASVAEAIARDLAPVRDVGSSGAAADIPRSVSLLELVDLVDIAPARVRARWDARHGTTLDAVIGHRGDGPLELDMRADGPHALVAGTTGAGKSELLQTLVTGLALNHPPDRLSFLFVDYKGGAAFKDCVELPHTVGMVTDLDTHLTRRALLSLNAELRRREEILRDNDAKDLVALERRRPDIAPASLVIVIDEFAALKNEVPEFVDGVVDIAQRGRSLGVHLVLATQRPGGIVSENIRANTNLRVALRVSKAAESDDVIGDPSAARISRSVPGRGLLRTGHSELTDFQSAYVGGHSLAPEDRAGVRVRALHAPSGATGSDAEPDEDDPTDLERTVQAIGTAAEESGRPLPPSPWLPMLPEVLSLDALDARGGAAPDPRVLTLGLVDDPARQHQDVLRLDLERDGHLFVYGTSGSGKTTLLRSLAVSLARSASPERVVLYGLDFSGRGMLPIAALPHCGAVILADDEERITRLFTLLRREVDARSRLFAERGVNTLSEYDRLATPGPVLARTVILLDSYAGFRSAFENVNVGALIEAFTRIVADGRAVGVHAIATADRRNAVPPSVSSLVPRKLVLRQADDDEYGSFGFDRKATKGAVLPAGRGFCDGSLEIQTPLVGEDPSGDGSAAAIAAEAGELSARFPGMRAPQIKHMPTKHPRASLPAPSDAARPYIGVDEIDVAPVAIDLTESHFFIAGPYRSGRTSALATIVGSIGLAPMPTELHLLAPRRSALLELPGWATSARGSDACTEASQRLREIVQARSPDEEHAPLYVVIDDAGELADSPAATPLETILKRGRDVNVRVIAACESAAARGFSPWIREIRKDANGLLLTPDLDLDGDLLAIRLPRRSSRSFPPGRGYLVSGGRLVHLQVASDAT
jgi:S-DNA-T family DNA segregation ATPase FtsK/SpoIIIE